MRKLFTQIIKNMAGQSIQFYSKESDNTNWLWLVEKDYSGLIGWDRHYHGIQIYSFNRFIGKTDLNTKGYREADPEVAKEVLSSLVSWLSKVMATTETQISNQKFQHI